MENTYQKELKNISKESGIAGFGFFFFFFINYLISVVLTRTLGSDHYGVFSLGMSIIIFANSISLLGFDQTVVKFISHYRIENNYKDVKGIIAFSLLSVLIFSMITVLILYIYTGTIAKILKAPELLSVFRYFIPLVPVLNLLSIFMNIFTGFERPKIQVIAENIFVPGLVFVLLILASFTKIGLIRVIFFYVFSNFLVILWVMARFKKDIGQLIRTIKPDYHIVEWIKFSMPLYLQTFLIRSKNKIPVYIISYFMVSRDIGIYDICLKVSAVLTISLRSFNLVFAPKISKFYGQKKIDLIESFYKSGTKWIFTFSLSLFMFFVLFAKDILTIFGKDFTEGQLLLVIVLTGELVNVSIGSAGNILIMTNKVKVSFYNSLISLFITILFSVLFIPKFGLLGAGIAQMLSVSIINLLRLAQVYYFEKIHPYKLSYWKPAFSVLISSAVTYIFKMQFQSHFLLNIALGGILFFSLFIMVLLLLRLDDDEKQLFQEVLVKVGLKK
ncbi:MAG: flippase [Candidatus Marinimicrobia bacterium]|nr:flippase [Candidatus Neomarinimicrobiota bacterium]